MSFLALRAADILGVHESEARTFAQSQLGYILGSSGRSYMIYNSSTSPQFAKHKASYVHVHNCITEFRNEICYCTMQTASRFVTGRVLDRAAGRL